MGRNNPQNIKKHNDKLHKEQQKAKHAEALRKEKLKASSGSSTKTGPNLTTKPMENLKFSSLKKSSGHHRPNGATAVQQSQRQTHRSLRLPRRIA
jgi:hypothetical protein